MLLTILLTIHIIVSIALTGVVLLQRSEGGALGMGGGSSGFMTARGAGDLLTRTTWVLATLFVVLSLAMTLLAGRERSAHSLTDRLKVDAIDMDALRKAAPPTPAQPVQQAPLTTAPGAVGQPAPLEAPRPTVHSAPAANDALSVPTPAPAAQ